MFIPKYRKKAIYGGLREQLGEVLRQRALHRESRVEDGHLLVDHVHMLVSIPPKYSVARWSAIARGRRDPHRPRVGGSVPELRGAALLGAGVLRLDRGSRRASDSRIYPAAGTRRSAAGSVADGLEEATFRWRK